VSSVPAALLAPGPGLARPWARVVRSPSAGAHGGPTLSARAHHRDEKTQLLSSAAGLRMKRHGGAGDGGYNHEPVMVDEIVDLLASTPDGLAVDATVGGGGHAAALLSACPRLHLVGIDRDPSAVAAATHRLAEFGSRARVVQGRFDHLAETVAEEAPGHPVVAILFDLGVSSVQFDDGRRGFSYRFDAPLDMRMDPADVESAADLVNEWSEEELAALIADNGEDRFSRRIARAIVANRPIHSTAELAGLVQAAIPAAARHRRGHPAKRVFQALRIAVNQELEVLGPAIDQAVAVLAPRGRCAVLSYHSGEDRVVKNRFAEAALGWCSCPQSLPCVCGAVPALRLLNRGARMPGAEEIARNPRSSSARLRAVERLDGPLVRPASSGAGLGSASARTDPGSTSRRGSQRRGDGYSR
jgi:16S rRNA (cytosine1402-N4)-methyltransferase